MGLAASMAVTRLFRTLAFRMLQPVLCALLCALAATPGQAGVMTRERLQQLFPAPLTVGERDAALPVWPVFKQDATRTALVGYLFESIDLAPVPGFSGTPVNLLVALDAQGRFTDVRVLSHHEPVFLDGLGEAPLLKFVAQYAGLSLQQHIKIVSAQSQGDRAQSANVYLDGVAKATASVRIVQQSLLSAALKVARAKLGYAPGRDPERVGRVRADVFEPLDWAGLLKAQLVQHVVLPRAVVEQAFAGTAGEGARSAAATADAPFVELWLALLHAPAAGRNLLDAGGWQHLNNRLERGDHALLVVGRGVFSFVGVHFTRGAVPDRITLRQGALPIELRDLDLDDPLRLPEALRGAESKVFRIIGPAGLDPAAPMEVVLRVTRSKGLIYPERVSRDFRLPFTMPAAYVEPPPDEATGWRAVWVSRTWELGVLAAVLALLAAVLARPGWLVRTPRRLPALRTGFAAFTLVGIGWFAQGQLSIVQLTAPIRALREGRDLTFLLYDPVSVVLWGFVLVTLLAWGRGTFCGWLCPFGALQELVARATAALGVKRRPLHRRWDARLKRLKYGVLALILGAACVSAPWTDRLVEIEPFKTAITLNFVRAWPYVAYAVGLLLLATVVNKAFCRYLCPLGAALALLGRVRLLDWLPRRAECGTPCQTCRHRCGYQAIKPAGTISYDECFQCLECVVILESDQQCAPRMIAIKRARA
jgi:transcriptional regulator of nitric oxide reductase